MLQPDDHGAVDGRIELTMTAMVDPVFATGQPGAGWYGADTGHFGEGSFRGDAFGIVPSDDQDFSRGIGTELPWL